MSLHSCIMKEIVLYVVDTGKVQLTCIRTVLLLCRNQSSFWYAGFEFWKRLWGLSLVIQSSGRCKDFNLLSSNSIAGIIVVWKAISLVILRSGGGTLWHPPFWYESKYARVDQDQLKQTIFLQIFYRLSFTNFTWFTLGSSSLKIWRW